MSTHASLAHHTINAIEVWPKCKQWYIGYTVCMTGWCNHSIPPTVTSLASFDVLIKTRTEYRWLFRHKSPDMYFVVIAEALLEGMTIAISDGSHTNYWGMTAWWILTNTDEKRQCWGLYVTPGRRGDHSAFHSELGGVCTMMVAISLLCDFFNITQGSVEI
jgi:hypothetical protein